MKRKLKKINAIQMPTSSQIYYSPENTTQIHQSEDCVNTISYHKMHKIYICATKNRLTSSYEHPKIMVIYVPGF